MGITNQDGATGVRPSEPQPFAGEANAKPGCASVAVHSRSRVIDGENCTSKLHPYMINLVQHRNTSRSCSTQGWSANVSRGGARGPDGCRRWLPVVCQPVVDQAGGAAGECADAGAFATASERTHSRPRAGAAGYGRRRVAKWA